VSKTGGRERERERELIEILRERGFKSLRVQEFKRERAGA
jgi:Holliday junction resolvase